MYLYLNYIENGLSYIWNSKYAYESEATKAYKEKPSSLTYSSNFLVKLSGISGQSQWICILFVCLFVWDWEFYYYFMIVSHILIDSWLFIK